MNLSYLNNNTSSLEQDPIRAGDRGRLLPAVCRPRPRVRGRLYRGHTLRLGAVRSSHYQDARVRPCTGTFR